MEEEKKTVEVGRSEGEKSRSRQIFTGTCSPPFSLA